jgi:signal transduction histidine kinase
MALKAQNVVKINGGFKMSTFEGGLMVFVDSSKVLTSSNIASNELFKELKSPTLNMGFNEFPIWGKFEVENNSNKPKSLILQFRKSFTDTVNFYKVISDSLVFLDRFKWTQNFNERPYPDINPTFEFILKPRSKEIFYFKVVKNWGSWHLVPTLYDSAYYEAIYSKKLMLQTGILLGIFVLGFFFVTSFYFLSKQRLFLYYALYQLFFVLFYFSATEVLHYFFNEDVPNYLIDQYAASLYQLLIFLIYGSFTIRFFNIQQKGNSLIIGFYRLYSLIIVITIVIALIFYKNLSNNNEFQIHLNISGLTLFVLVCLCIYFGKKHRIRGTNSYALAQSPIFFALIFWSLSSLGVLPKNQNYTLIFGLAFLAENILMLFALAIQLRFYFKAKEKKFTSEIVEALENERNQIAMNLHDELGGSLSTVKRKLEDVISGINNQARFFNELLKVFEIVKDTNQTLRRVSHNLAPAELQRLGLVNSLEQLCNSFTNSNLRVDFYNSGKSSKLSHQIEVNLYRIASEALQNIVKHSGASNAEVSINFFEKELNLIVSDNGRWKVSDKDGMGLKNIRLRVEYLNGILNIDKGSNGTHLTVELLGL